MKASMPPHKPLFAAKSRIKTPTKEGYAIYKEYKEKVRKLADEKKLPPYMQSKFKAKLEAQTDQQQLMYATNGTNFSVNLDDNQEMDEGMKDSFGREIGKGSMTSVLDATLKRRLGKQQSPTRQKASQVSEFLRLESKGITSIASVASKPPSDRDDTEKQFFVMFLKLRIPFFADFDKKALKVIMERMLCQDYRRG